MEVLGVILFAVIVYSICVIYHGPWFKVNEKEKEQIRERGLIHFTNPKHAQAIINGGLEGQLADMKGPELLLGELVWTYSYEGEESVERAYHILQKKKRAQKDPQRYKCCLKLTGFSETDMQHFYKRIGFSGDKAIVYRGKILEPEKIIVLKEW